MAPNDMFGVFSEPGSLAAGAPYVERKEGVVGRFQGRQLATAPPKKGSANDTWLDREVRSNAFGEPFVDAWLIDKRLQQRGSGGARVSSKPFCRSVRGAGSVVFGPGSGDGCLSPLPLDTDASAAAVRSKPPRRPADAKRNIYVRPPPRGGFGMPPSSNAVGEVFGWMPDGYEGGRAIERASRAKDAKLGRGAFVTAGRCKQGLTAADAQLYARAAPPPPPPAAAAAAASSGAGGADGGGDGGGAAGGGRPRWRPSSPPARGATAAFSLPVHMADPVREAKCVASSSSKGAAAFRPIGGSKQRLSMWTPNPYSTAARPAQDIDFTTLP